ncbi:MAG: Holliday junction DNA helicase RuvA [Planctomycetota bacterium]|jgi:Holliday junction DNA helicase RuvA
MYDFIEGPIASRSAATLVVNAGGVGYELRVPLGVPFAKVGEQARVYVHLTVRDDAHILFGFPSKAARQIFRTMLTVRGVGPSMALAVLSGLSHDELVQAIVSGDAKALQRIKGVGKKTADQILLDLSDKTSTLSTGSVTDGVLSPTPPPSNATNNIEDATQALMSIGYKEPEARKLVELAAEQVDPSDLDALVRTSIRL